MTTQPRPALLLVDDDPKKRLSIETLLADIPVEIVAVGSGREALSMLLRQEFALILLDIQMPIMDGFETASLIRQRLQWRSTPIIFITSFSRAEVDLTRGYALGAVDFLFLPITPEALRSKVRTSIEFHLMKAGLENLVAERTADLARQNTLLGQVNDELTALVRSSPVAIYATDPGGIVTMWSPAAERLSGFSSEEAIGSFIPIVQEDEIERVKHNLLRLCRGEAPSNAVLTRRRKNGSAVELKFSAGPLTDESGVARGAIFMAEDVTEVKRLEQQLRQAQKMEAVGQLTGGLAHDFNNLLGIILGNLDFVVEVLEPGDRDYEFVDSAIKAATRGAELTRQLLAFARQQPLAPAVTNIPETLAATVSLLRRTLGEGIVLKMKVPQDLAPVLIDVSQLESAILNLAVNARDAMPNGGRLTIEAANVRLDKGAVEMNVEAVEGDYVVVSVSDTGVGMTPEVTAHVFEPFFTTKGKKGTGLGLSMVHGFVKQSGGHTRIYSEPGRGTTIQIYLPVTDALSSIKVEDGTAIGIASGEETILVVEDNDGLRDISVRQLKSLGYQTIAAGDAGQALEILRSATSVNLLFTDIVMPGLLDGTGLAAAARALRPELRILFTSGFTAAAASSVVGEEFGTNLLSKPYRKAQLGRCVREAIDGGT